MRRRWAIAAVAVGLLGAHAAQAQAVGENFILAPPATPPGDEQTATERQPLLAQQARAERSVRIDVPIEIEVIGKWFRNVKMSLPAGSILHSASLDNHVLCLPMKETYTACFEDTHGDGRLDSQMDAAANQTLGATYIALRPDGAVTPAVFAAPRPLTPAVTYRDVAPEEAPSAPLEIYWWSNHSASAPDRPVRINLSLSFGAGRRDGRALTGRSQVATISAAGGVVEFAGARIRVLGFLPNGSIRYVVERPMPPRPERISLW